MCPTRWCNRSWCSGPTKRPIGHYSFVNSSSQLSSLETGFIPHAVPHQECYSKQSNVLPEIASEQTWFGCTIVHQNKYAERKGHLVSIVTTGLCWRPLEACLALLYTTLLPPLPVLRSHKPWDAPALQVGSSVHTVLSWTMTTWISLKHPPMSPAH